MKTTPSEGGKQEAASTVQLPANGSETKPLLEGESPSPRAASPRERTEEVPGLGPVVIDDDAHVCFVFPIISAENTAADGPKWQMPIKQWMKQTYVAHRYPLRILTDKAGQPTPADHAKRLFRNWQVFPGEEKLRSVFDSVQTFQEYSEAFRKIFLEKIQGSDCGLEVSVDLSVDEDEVFLKVKLPTDQHVLEKLPAVQAPPHNGSASVPAGDAIKEFRGMRASKAELLADRYMFRMPVRKEAYTRANEAVQKRARHQEAISAITAPTIGPGSSAVYYPAYAGFTLKRHKCNGKDSPFMDFQSWQLIKLAYMSIREHFDLSELLHQGQISSHFAVHNYHDGNTLLAHWGSMKPTCTGFGDLSIGRQLFCGLVPSHGLAEAWDDELKDYFGDEVGFLFFFITHYTGMLIFPALLGALLWFRASYPFYDSHRYVMSCFALILALWAAYFVQNYLQSERARIIRWNARAVDQRSGTRKVLTSYNQLDEDKWVPVRAAIDAGHSPWTSPIWQLLGRIHRSLHSYTSDETLQFNSGWLRVQCFKLLGSTVLLSVMVAVVSGVIRIQWMRMTLRRTPENYVDHLGLWWELRSRTLGDLDMEGRLAEVANLGAFLGALLITVQIRVLDFFWDMFARWVVKKENHRTEEFQMDALVSKLFFVKLVNVMYPYVYIIFIKEHIDGCHGAHGCLSELQDSLITYFVSSALLDICFAIYTWRAAVSAAKKEIAKQTDKSKQYSYLQLQAKLDPAAERLDDMLPFVVQFAFVCSFTVACPMLPLMALVYNTIMGKFTLQRRLRLERRCYPSSSEGIGVWNALLDTSKTVACIVNVGIVAFAQLPMRDWKLLHKLIAFIALEHAMLFIVLSMRFLVSPLPKEATRLDEYNQECHDLLLDPEASALPEAELDAPSEQVRVPAEAILPDVGQAKRLKANGSA